MPTWSELQKMQKVPGPKGSQGGDWYLDTATGNKYLVKPAKSLDHAQNEAAIAAIYRAGGVPGTPNVAWTMDDNGDAHIISQEIQISQVPYTGASKIESRKNMGIDMVTSNWDAYGSGGSNVGLDPNGNIVRIDFGGGGLFRAKGDPKPSFDPNAPWSEIYTMIADPRGFGPEFYGLDVTNKEFADAMKQVADLDIKALDDEMIAAGVGTRTRKNILDVIDARRAQASILEKQYRDYEDNSRVNVTPTSINPGGAKKASLRTPVTGDGSGMSPAISPVNTTPVSAIPPDPLPDVPVPALSPPKVRQVPTPPAAPAGKKPASKVANLSRNDTYLMRIDMDSMRDKVLRAKTAAELDAAEKIVKDYIDQLVISRDRNLDNWRKATPNSYPSKVSLGKQFAVDEEKIRLLTEWFTPGGFFETAEADALNKERNAIIKANESRRSLRALRQRISKVVPEDALKVTPGTDRTNKEIEDLQKANYADGTTVFGAPEAIELDDASEEMLARALDIFDDGVGGGRNVARGQFLDENGERHDDAVLFHLLRAFGFDRKPVQVNRNELLNLEDSGWHLSYRGVQGGSPPEDDAQTRARKFREGVLFANGAGNRMYGAGQYLSSKPHPSYFPNIGVGLPENQERGGIAVAISPDAKIISHNAIRQIQRDFFLKKSSIDSLLRTNPNASASAIIGNAGGNPLAVLYAKAKIRARDGADDEAKARAKKAAEFIGKMDGMLSDEGYVSILLGYDGIYIPAERYYVMNNRSAFAVLNEELNLREANGINNNTSLKGRPSAQAHVNVITSAPTYVPPGT